jgi:hypothetical protein
MLDILMNTFDGIREEIMILKNGRKFPPGYDALFGEPMGYFKSIAFIIKMSFWVLVWKPSKRISVWFVRVFNIYTWLVLYNIAADGNFAVAMLISVIALILCFISSIYETGMERRLIMMWGFGVPFVLVATPILALLIMGGNNRKGLKGGKPNHRDEPYSPYDFVLGYRSDTTSYGLKGTDIS